MKYLFVMDSKDYEVVLEGEETKKVGKWSVSLLKVLEAPTASKVGRAMLRVETIAGTKEVLAVMPKT